MFRIELTEKQIALEQIRDLLRSYESSGHPPSKAFLLELHKILSRLSESYPETKVSPLSIKARKLLKELNLKNIGALEKKIRRKENRRKRNKPASETLHAAEPTIEKSEDMLDSRLLYKGSFGSGKRR
ncbi:hypothetical protein PSEUDO8Z_80013 [Pseudomonas sp. 8Z]|uniref:hypothetical protein n=1 Tax=Pseudomonas sp. 8Z TaxID=2653166 RepID=UPI0012F36166|nr:hypothetical protein [Pseudomonas sp. 8Z]VXD04546.1 hypothetical protein PSEUDO8Z_80013 [Pseudomonas sp. 8Z]